MALKFDKKALDLAIASLEKDFGKNAVFYGDALPEEVEVIPTGNFGLDLALQVGGFPKGRIVHVYGGEGLGKSLLALSTVAECQMAGGLVAYIDAECDVDPDWATYNGVNLKELVFAQPESGEEALEILDTLVRTGCFDLIVVDSVAALTPKAELEGTMTDQQMGLQARMMAKGLRKTRNAISENNVCVFFINQVREKIGPVGGTVAPGGRALKFYSSVQIELKKIKSLTDSRTGESTGSTIKALIQKNKVGRPMKSLEYDVLHGLGFNNFGFILQKAVEFKLLEKRGAYYYRQGEEKFFAQGEKSACEYLASDLDFTRELKEQIKKNYV